jgi:hypothetical protein
MGLLYHNKMTLILGTQGRLFIKKVHKISKPELLWKNLYKLFFQKLLQKIYCEDMSAGHTQ